MSAIPKNTIFRRISSTTSQACQSFKTGSDSSKYSFNGIAITVGSDVRLNFDLTFADLALGNFKLSMALSIFFRNYSA
jgi:hypothetical protein